MLKRKIDASLHKWSDKKNKKCLIVMGARQVGKTFSIEHFGEENYDDVVSINFKETPSACEIFQGDLDVDTMITAFRFRFPDKAFHPGKTLIFLDEIQECSEAITSLKFWAIDNRYDVIASGSLLGIDYNRASSYPVGYVEHIHMYSLDFEEFLWSMGVTTDLIESLHTMFTEKSVVPQAIHSKMMEHLRTYLAIGGMPEVVWNFVSSHNYSESYRIGGNILQGYLYDIAHYATANEKVKAEKCYLSLTKQLLDKENHKFQYKEIEKGARAQKYYSSIEWLVRADIANMSKLVTNARFDLNDYARDDFFRLYTTDLTLLVSMKDFQIRQQIVENTLSGNTKGGLYECMIADMLYKRGYSLFFYKNETKNQELDFLVQRDGAPIPIEVKSANSRATSLNRFLDDNVHIETAYKFIDGNMGTGDNGVITAPLYMAMFL